MYNCCLSVQDKAALISVQLPSMCECVYMTRWTDLVLYHFIFHGSSFSDDRTDGYVYVNKVCQIYD